MLQPRILGDVAAAPGRLSGSWRAGPGSRPPGWHRSCLGMEEYWGLSPALTSQPAPGTGGVGLMGGALEAGGHLGGGGCALVSS